MPSQAKYWEVNAFLRLFVEISPWSPGRDGKVRFSAFGSGFSSVRTPNQTYFFLRFSLSVKSQSCSMSHKDIMIETHEFWPSFGTPFTCQAHTKWVEKFKDNSYYLPHIVKHAFYYVVGGKENQSKKKRVTDLKVQRLPQRGPIHSLTDWLLKPTQSLAIEWAGFPNPDMHGDEIKIMRVPVASGCTFHGFWEASLIPQFVS
ncbi:hypothetical protein DFH07DRAFT_778133 [Mycena maculata]|uniref:Uncharacterized protein n=1 Tax=Mycena maculata TaxID=230809 RepID=A0AAD7IEU2_9AGAR|nr:hypothetical protein DFH07DRAFT_778133 [Mycena maculata]